MNEARYMMATTATHKLGDLSRDEPDICRITEEDDENYIGNWLSGFGFVNVRFPKATTRPLTAEEIAHYNGLHVVIGDVVLGTLALR